MASHTEIGADGISAAGSKLETVPTRITGVSYLMFEGVFKFKDVNVPGVQMVAEWAPHLIFFSA